MFGEVKFILIWNNSSFLGALSLSKFTTAISGDEITIEGGFCETEEF